MRKEHLRLRFNTMQKVERSQDCALGKLVLLK